MKKKLWIPLLVSALTLMSLTANADYAKWTDPTHSFKADHTIYTSVVNTDVLSKKMALEGRSFQVIFNQKAAEVKGLKIITAPLQGAIAVLSGNSTDDASAAAPSDEVSTSAVRIPQAAVDAKAALYAVPTVTRCEKLVSVVPAHTEWTTKEIHETVRDKNGYKDVVHKIPFPEQIPEKQYVTMYLTVRFDVYSMKTGALVFTSEDARDRLDDSNFNGLFTRIVERFFKNLKSEIN